MTKPSARSSGFADSKSDLPSDPTTYLFHLLGLISRHREAKLEAVLAPLGLSFSRQRALSAVATHAPCAMTALAEHSAVERTTMTRIIDQLVEAGLVERTTPRNDRRQVVLTLTELGEATCRASLKAVGRLNRSLAGDLPDETQRAAVRAFESILGNLVEDDDLLERLLLRRAKAMD